MAADRRGELLELSRGERRAGLLPVRRHALQGDLRDTRSGRSRDGRRSLSQEDVQPAAESGAHQETAPARAMGWRDARRAAISVARSE